MSSDWIGREFERSRKRRQDIPNAARLVVTKPPVHTLMHERTVIDLSTPDPVGGERCRHDMVAAWCANCLNLPDVPLLDRPDEREVY